MLKSDEQGFLIGQMVDTGKALVRGQTRGLEILERIDGALSGMAQRGYSASSGRSGTRSGASAVAALSAASVTAGGHSGPVVIAEPAGRSSSVQRTIASTAKTTAAAAVAATMPRAKNGRFMKRGGNGVDEGGAPAPGGGGGGGGSSKDDHRVIDATKDMVASITDKMDPMVEAAKEVWEPLGRGWKSVFGDRAEKKKERWYKRILRAITGRQAGQAQVASSSGSGGGILSSIGGGLGGMAGRLGSMMLRAIPAVLMRVFAPVAAIWGAWNAGQWIGEKIHDWMVSSGFESKMFDMIDGIRDAWTRMVDTIANFWKEKIENPVKETINNAGDAVNGAFDAGVSYVKRLVGVDGKKRIYEMSDGTTQTRDGGTVSWRNNNPGNLKFEYSGSADKTVKSGRTKSQALAAAQAKYDGVVDLDQYGNAIFATPDMGRAAKLKLLQGQYGSKTVSEMLGGYAKDDYSGKADPAAYARSVYKYARDNGINLDGRTIGSLSAQELGIVANAMQRFEGSKAGVVTTSGVKAVSPSLKTVSVPSINDMSMVGGSFSVPDVIAPSIPTADKDNLFVSLNIPISQSVPDRSIAHVARGGIGSN